MCHNFGPERMNMAVDSGGQRSLLNEGREEAAAAGKICHALKQTFEVCCVILLNRIDICSINGMLWK